MMKVSFTLNKRGKSVSFRNTSREVPAGSTYLWDFGVNNDTSTDENPPNKTYENQGFYQISLKVTPPAESNQEPQIVYDSIGISENDTPTLSDSIYNLIEAYLPDELVNYITQKDKRIYIEKWQLYIQPLVNHEVPLEEYNNEFAYFPLENQLVMELAAYDWMLTGIMNLMRSVTNVVQDSTSSTDPPSPVDPTTGNVKKIVTGPTEVEFFENKLSGDEAASLTKSINSAIQPGGLLDSIKQNICMLSERLDIYLPMCRRMDHSVLPEVANHRVPGLLGGPNPSYPIKK